jgi:hypothetical protein
VVDFHALRHTYISRVVASGANIKVAQELARHSTPTLTLGRYAHVRLLDQTRAFGRPARHRGPTGQRRGPGGNGNVERRLQSASNSATSAQLLQR